MTTFLQLGLYSSLDTWILFCYILYNYRGVCITIEVQCLTKHFLLYAPQIRPLLLLLDGHSIHYCPETINIAAMHNIIMFTLPPHTTHITQPLDRGCFAPLKVEWRQVCHTFLHRIPERQYLSMIFVNSLQRHGLNLSQ